MAKYLTRNSGGKSSQVEVSMGIFYPESKGKPPSFSIADHYAEDKCKKRKGTDKQNCKAEKRAYIIRINGGIITKADYFNKLLANKKLPVTKCTS